MNENYEKYLQSDEWRQLRKQVIQRDGGRCFICGNTDNLQVHHLYYPEFDTPKNLVTLCSRCHSDLHCFYKEVFDSVRNGELKEELGNVRKALLAYSRAVYKIQDKYVFRRSKELSKTGDITFFTGDNKSHIKHKSKLGDKTFETGETKLTRYTRLLFELSPYKWELLNPFIGSLSAFNPTNEKMQDENAEKYRGRGFNAYQELRMELFGSSKAKKKFNLTHLLECVRKHGKNSVYSSYLEFLKK